MPVNHSRAQSAMDRWIAMVSVMLTTDSIDPSVKDFFPLIDSIDHRSQNPYQNDDHRSIGSYSTDGIDPLVKNRFPYPFFYMKESQDIFFNNMLR
jgi:hypothetical protein